MKSVCISPPPLCSFSLIRPYPSFSSKSTGTKITESLERLSYAAEVRVSDAAITFVSTKNICVKSLTFPELAPGRVF